MAAGSVSRLGFLLLWLAGAGAMGCAETATTPASPSPSPTPEGSFTLSGTVRELLSSGPGWPIAGVRVDVIYKSGSGASGTTDGDGKFSVSVVAARPFRLEANRSGYVSARRETLGLTADVAWELLLEPIPVTLTGRVTETAPTEHTPVPGARIAIVRGPQMSRSVTAGSDGTYTLSQVWGDFELEVSQANYRTASAHVSLEGVDARLDVALEPVGPVLTEFSGKVCGAVPDYYSWLRCAVTPLEVRHAFVVTRSGTLSLDMQYDYVGDYYPNSLGIEIRCGADIVTSTRAWNLWDSRTRFGATFSGARLGPIPVTVSRPSACEARLFDYAPDLKGGRAWTTYRVLLNLPRS